MGTMNDGREKLQRKEIHGKVGSTCVSGAVNIVIRA